MGAADRVRGVVFDLDGTLYDKRALEWYMLRSMPLALLRLLRYTRVRSGLAGHDLGDAEALARVTLDRLGGDEAARGDWQRWIAARYEPRLLRGLREASRPYPGTAALLLRLRAAEVRLGLVSDYRGVPERLAALGLAPSLFDFVLVTEEQGAMKPAARMALSTLSGMGLPGSAMVMVGDRAFTDQRFAEAAGMRFLGVRPRGKVDATWMRWPEVASTLLRLAQA